MAVEVEATGQVDEFLRVLKRRVWWIVVPLAFIGSIGVFFAVVVPKKYVADTEIMVMNMPDATSDTGERVAAIEGQVAPSNLKSQVRILSILEHLNWDDFRPLGRPQKTEYMTSVRSDITVELPAAKPNSERQIVVVTYKNTDPERSLEFLQELIKSWKDEVLRRNLQQEDKELAETSQQLSLLNRRLHEIGTTETEIRTQNGITPPRRTVLGVEQQAHHAYGDLDDVERTISKLEDELEFETGELALMRDKRDPMSRWDESGDAVADSPIQRQILDIDMAIERLLLERDAGGWGPLHSSRVRIDREIERQQARRAKLRLRQGSSGFQTQTSKPNKERQRLTEAIDDLARRLEQKEARLSKQREVAIELRQKVARLNDANAELESLAHEKETFRGATIVLQERLSQLEINVARLRSKEGDPFTELKAPVEPTDATSPNPYIIGIGSIIAGLGLGLALAILLEYSKNCFRSGRELRRVMPHPVLGTINSIRTRGERARGLVVRVVMGGGSAAFVVSVIFVTWAWGTDRDDLLTGTLVDAIDGFRRMLM